MRKQVVTALMSILIVASLGIGYLAGSNGRSTETTTSTSTSVNTSVLTSQHTVTSSTTSTTTETVISVPGAAATATDSNGSTGIALVLAVSATTLQLGQSLEVNISLFNTLPKVHSVPTSDDWLFQGIPVAIWPPCFSTDGILPAEVVVVTGNYDLGNISDVADYHFSYRCLEAGNIDHVIFQPSSSQANLTGFSGAAELRNGTSDAIQLSASFNTSGYWNLPSSAAQENQPIIGDLTSANPLITTLFVPGIYTVAVADEWGQAVILHFTVASFEGTG